MLLSYQRHKIVFFRDINYPLNSCSVEVSVIGEVLFLFV